LSYEDFLTRLNPKVASALKTAESNEIVKLETASYGVNRELGGGIAKGRVNLTFGPASSGKSLLWQQSIGLWQKQGLVCAWVDVEDAYDKEWAAKLGVNNEELIMINAKSSGRIEDEIRPLLEAKVDVLVIDSISDILPEVFLDEKGQMNKQDDRKQMASTAKAVTALINGIHYLNQGTAVCLISQTYNNIGKTYNELIPHGGNKVQFGSSQIISLYSSASPNAQIKGEVEVDGHYFIKPIGREVDVLIKKNKLGAPFGTCTYNMYYAGDYVGIDVAGEIVEEALAFGVIDQSGAWFKYTNERQWQGKKSLQKAARTDPALLEEIKGDIALARNGGEIK
jgi:recombination protein RecA